MYQLGWYLRLYQDLFRNDQQSPLELLQNFLTIPLIFSVTALQWSNATCELAPSQPNCADFSMPDNMSVTASAAKSASRFMGVKWVIVLFIAVGTFVVMCPGALLAWIISRREALPFDPSNYPDKDAMSLFGSGQGAHQSNSSGSFIYRPLNFERQKIRLRADVHGQQLVLHIRDDQREQEGVELVEASSRAGVAQAQERGV